MRRGLTERVLELSSVDGSFFRINQVTKEFVRGELVRVYRRAMGDEKPYKRNLPMAIRALQLIRKHQPMWHLGEKPQDPRGTEVEQSEKLERMMRILARGPIDLPS